MIRAGVAHYVAHTNADVADPGVSDALAHRLGLTDLHPLEVDAEEAVDKLVVFVPAERTESLIDALAAAGAGAIGQYDRCAWVTDGDGTFRPLAGSNPTLGNRGEITKVREARIEMIVPRARQSEVIAALRAAHPYEEPAFDLLTQAPLPSRRGSGRVGTLGQAMQLKQFVEHVAAVLPATAWGVRAAGEPDQFVRTVAVCGGSGATLTEQAARAGADVYVTADLKHHATLESVIERGPGAMALVDAGHWSTEAPWLDAVAARLVSAFGTTVEARVSRLITDPWTLHAASPLAADRPQEANT
jgi:hypothetical protein